jgi:sugar-specific transcriptional regulator TrmB
MEAKTNKEIVFDLIGQIEPVGESDIDQRRFKSLRDLTELVEELLSEISQVAVNKDRQEHSMKIAGEIASHFLRDVVTEFVASPTPSVSAKEFYEQQRKKGNTDSITGNTEPDYSLPFYQNTFVLMDFYAQSTNHR